MEARQHLSTPVTLRYFSRVDIAIRVADPLPGTIFVELILANTASGGRAKHSFGEVGILSASGETEKELPLKGMFRIGPPWRGILRFDLTPELAIEEFDEFRIVFHLRRPRRHRSANVAIDSFYLVPRSI